VTVNAASFSGPGFDVTGLATPLTLSAGQTSSFTAVFGPSSAGSATGSVLLRDSGGNTLLTIPMSGTGVSTVSHSVDLGWNPSTSTVAGYRVYRGAAPGGPYNLISTSLVPTTLFTDSAVNSGSTYFYVVTAVDSGNNESAFSNEASAVIPIP
jgi:hypothetical protein